MIIDFLILVVQEIWHLLRETSIVQLVGSAFAGVPSVFALARPGRRLVVR